MLASDRVKNWDHENETADKPLNNLYCQFKQIGSVATFFQGPQPESAQPLFMW